MSDLIVEIITDGICSERLQWLLVAVGGALVTFLKVRGKRWADPILWGLATSALLALLFFALVAHARLQQLPPLMRVESAEQLVYEWIKVAGYSLERLDADDMHFAFRIQRKGVGRDDITLVVGRPKKQARFVSVAAAHTLYPREDSPLRMLSPDKAQTLLYELQFDMDRIGVDHDGFAVGQTDPTADFLDDGDVDVSADIRLPLV
jgi:hypothetical protein